ncbi:MAG: FdhF/YdeP family oxidoreductase [Planctomycetes bacterium]|nr:FdhF/YdeP family oxidoreductase [Planctomycetota bacterium]
MPRARKSLLSLAAGWRPFGIGLTKPRHFRDMLRIAWENRDALPHAWNVLTRGVCDGCALGTSGLKDWTIPGTHLCMVRLELLRLNTMGALDPTRLEDVGALRARSSKELRALGRIPHPLRRRRGERGFARVTWDEVWRDVGARWRATHPERSAMFVTSRGVTNETYYVAQKVMRYLGSNSVDNSARLCHSPSTSGLKTTVGVAATTCSYTDWFEADLIVFLGSNPANDQPVTTKYLAEAKRRGARIVSVNTFKEPGLERYWIPSSAESALFGTELCDRHYLVGVGGDLAFLTAVAKVVVAQGFYDAEFVASATAGFEAWRAHLERQSLDDLARLAGTSRREIEDFAAEIRAASRGVLVWSMGITQHVHGADTVRAIANLGLLKEWVGRPGTGLMPIRGHSGVQGGAEMGCYATAFPGGVPIDAESAAHFSRLWGFEVPRTSGRTTVEYLDAAHEGGLDALWCIGGNFLETLPDPARCARALSRVSLRVHTDLVVTTQMLVEPAEVAYVLPARTRYEQDGGGTETTTERRVIFSPEIPGHQVGDAQTEWRLLLALARAVKPEGYARVHFQDAAAIRAEIERAVPAYRGIAALSRPGDQFQWGGPRLCAERAFPTADGRAHFQVVAPPRPQRAPGSFVLATRRGKQFNSMIQRDHDPLTGADRDHVFVSHADAARLGLAPDERVVVRNAHGSLRGRAFLAEVAEGTLQAHWPEANVLLAAGRVDPFGGVPDYNAEVFLERDTTAR